MCGGKLVIHPCSRVGHVFRKASPYTFPGGTDQVLSKNKVRLAEVWMDEWKKFFTATVSSARVTNPGDLTKRKQLREQLRCHSFQWYLETIYPESPFPLHYQHLGQVVHVETGLCLDTMGRKTTEEAGAVGCHGKGGPQIWCYTDQHELRAEDVCLDAVGDDGLVKLWTCHGMGGNQVWRVGEGGTIEHGQTGGCLVVLEDRLGLGECC